MRITRDYDAFVTRIVGVINIQREQLRQRYFAPFSVSARVNLFQKISRSRATRYLANFINSLFVPNLLKRVTNGLPCTFLIIIITIQHHVRMDTFRCLQLDLNTRDPLDGKVRQVRRSALHRLIFCTFNPIYRHRLGHTSHCTNKRARRPSFHSFILRPLIFITNCVATLIDFSERTCFL